MRPSTQYTQDKSKSTNIDELINDPRVIITNNPKHNTKITYNHLYKNYNLITPLLKWLNITKLSNNQEFKILVNRDIVDITQSNTNSSRKSKPQLCFKLKVVYGNILIPEYLKNIFITDLGISSATLTIQNIESIFKNKQSYINMWKWLHSSKLAIPKTINFYTLQEEYKLAMLEDTLRLIKKDRNSSLHTWEGRFYTTLVSTIDLIREHLELLNIPSDSLEAIHTLESKIMQLNYFEIEPTLKDYKDTLNYITELINTLKTYEERQTP